MAVVFLLGYMGSGKSTLGRKIAYHLACPFLDTDAEIERREGCSISAIFADKGESYFRELEAKLIDEISPDTKLVVSTGGGLPCHNGLMQVLLQKGYCVYLKRSVGELTFRLKNAKQQRPIIANLSDEELNTFVAEHLTIREPFYSQAQLTIDSKMNKASQIAALLKDTL